MEPIEDPLLPVLVELLEEDSLDETSSSQLARRLAECWSPSPLNVHAELLQRADFALGLRGSSLLQWFCDYPGLPTVVSLSHQTLLHLHDAYDLLDSHEDPIARRLRLQPRQVPTTFIATIEDGLAHHEHRQAGRGAISGLFGLETAYMIEGLDEQAMQAKSERNLLFAEISSL